MKKLISILMVFLLLGTFVIAQEGVTGTDTDQPEPVLISSEEPETEASDEEVAEVEEEAIDEETEEETKLISESNFGAKVRLLQLKKAVTKSYLISGIITGILSEKGEDASELESILAEIEVLKEEVSALDPTSETNVEDFVNIKRDIKDLNKQFKRTASPLLTPEDKQAIRDAIKDNEELATLNQDIRDSVLELNADRVGKALGRMGKSDQELVEKVKSGEATKAQVRERLRESYNGLTPGEKRAARTRISNIVRNRIELKERIAEKVRLEHVAVRRERLEQRLTKIPADKKSLTEGRINKNIQKLNRVEKKVEAKIENLRERRAKISGEVQSIRAQIREETQQEEEKAPSTGTSSGGGKK